MRASRCQPNNGARANAASHCRMGATLRTRSATLLLRAITYAHLRTRHRTHNSSRFALRSLVCVNLARFTTHNANCGCHLRCLLASRFILTMHSLLRACSRTAAATRASPSCRLASYALVVARRSAPLVIVADVMFSYKRGAGLSLLSRSGFVNRYGRRVDFYSRRWRAAPTGLLTTLRTRALRAL